VTTRVEEAIAIGKAGVTFEIWDKWKRKRRKLGTLTVSVGGLRWWPHKSPKPRPINWEELAARLQAVHWRSQGD
jgi:hypothetical protein